LSECNKKVEAESAEPTDDRSAAPATYIARSLSAPPPLPAVAALPIAAAAYRHPRGIAEKRGGDRVGSGDDCADAPYEFAIYGP
jgi:hypothetical protein